MANVRKVLTAAKLKSTEGKGVDDFSTFGLLPDDFDPRVARERANAQHLQKLIREGAIAEALAFLNAEFQRDLEEWLRLRETMLGVVASEQLYHLVQSLFETAGKPTLNEVASACADLPAFSITSSWSEPDALF